MGMFDTFLSRDESVQVQLKTGPCTLCVYREGESVGLDVADGIYVAPEGIVVIKDGHVSLVTQDKEEVRKRYSLKVFSKWGDEIDMDTPVDVLNPVAQVVDAISKKYEAKDGG